MRVALANDLGVAIPSGTVLTVTCRRWRFDSTGELLVFVGCCAALIAVVVT